MVVDGQPGSQRSLNIKSRIKIKMTKRAEKNNHDKKYS